MLIFLVLAYIQVILELFTLIIIIDTGINIGKSYSVVKLYHKKYLKWKEIPQDVVHPGVELAHKARNFHALVYYWVGWS